MGSTSHPESRSKITEANAAFFRLTGLGAPGGAKGLAPLEADHPLVSSWPEAPPD